MQDDPNFDVMNPLPRLDLLLAFGKDADNIFMSRCSTQKISQVTPLGSQQTISSGKFNSHFSINLPDSSHSGGSYRLPSDIGHYTPTMAKYHQERDPFGETHAHGEDEDSFGGLNLDIDSNGNILGIIDNNADLPRLPEIDEHEAQVFHEQLLQAGEEGPIFSQHAPGSGVHILGEMPLPAAEPFPRTMATKASSSSLSTLDSSESEVKPAPVKRRPRPKKHISMLDKQDRISGQEFRSWERDYVARMDAISNSPRETSLAKARKNAFALLYGNGIANVGAAHALSIDEICHPLAKHFSGHTLQAQLLGREVEHLSEGNASKGGRRRGRSEAFAED